MGDSPFQTVVHLPMNTREIKQLDDVAQWHCCCFEKKTDSRLIKFISVYLIILTVFLFTLIMLFYAKTCEDQTLYMSLLTLLLGIIIPTPR